MVTFCPVPARRVPWMDHRQGYHPSRYVLLEMIGLWLMLVPLLERWNLRRRYSAVSIAADDDSLGVNILTTPFSLHDTDTGVLAILNSTPVPTYGECGCNRTILTLHVRTHEARKHHRFPGTVHRQSWMICFGETSVSSTSSRLAMMVSPGFYVLLCSLIRRPSTTSLLPVRLHNRLLHPQTGKVPLPAVPSAFTMVRV